MVYTIRSTEDICCKCLYTASQIECIDDKRIINLYLSLEYKNELYYMYIMYMCMVNNVGS